MLGLEIGQFEFESMLEHLYYWSPGKLPPTIANLTHLVMVDISFNNITDIIQATEDFDIKYCIGTGAYGSVYRAQLPSGKIVALKKLHQLESQEPSFDRSFRNEVKMLTDIRHRNIVKLHGYCLHNRCMFLAYEYMDRGSLLWVLSNDDEGQELNWRKRFLSGGLETMMGKHPGEFISSSRNSGAPSMLLKGVLDSRLHLPFNARDAKDLVFGGTLALSCLCTYPISRPSMKNVANEFLASKPPLLLPFNDISIQQLINKESIYL
ncbi:hypothetical protein L6164_002840 [Bauhinia variegata]|uniref:Uncharacterized protein n=1 Tax=Bauhinia variegata TaxID=167791 RepID=A0ACB9PYW9_BAUVA|nr:hypothetical protein L6164_002840 [Bauhinia variegata]